MELDRCQCGSSKKACFRLCLPCARKEAEGEGRLCTETLPEGGQCGRFKKPDFDRCLDCERRKASAEGRICPECNNFKQPQYEKCRKCAFPASTKV